ncbi:putative conserved protein YlxW, UPF0749 family [Abditibacterium utsteinense]|uniref:Putative conserved protein YlxW, UPF0749 family n=1 Tax=Abditibacterium utsteinense TaxID=1960156 RepID=A0A2S8SSI4_9BACT|nr:DUF881 domain-containing protein [Abditibacterium utsteinense]PQV63773.1 putative conserved protein YlxW, UPF0749 family [Abditibacterium utsteinense]
MNASPLSASTSASRAEINAPKGARTGRSWIFSLTGVCFLFGGLLAMQLRATQQINANQKMEKAGIVEAKKIAASMKAQAEAGARERKKLNAQLTDAIGKLKKGNSLTATQVAALNSQIKDLQTVAGLTPISGPGVRLTLSDNPNAAQVTNTETVAPGWGMVHDYDLLQIVNELRSAKADAIAIKGPGGRTFRITSYTPIRCVGPVIYINWEPVAAPFTVEAVGDAETMKSALDMPNGIVDLLRNNGPVGVKVETTRDLRLPSAQGGAPKMRVAKVIP